MPRTLRVSACQTPGGARRLASARSDTTGPQQGFDVDLFESMPIERVRNFSIIAHVDHGKSTLADRLMELTGSMRATGKMQQVLDSLDVERERGITVKAQTVSMFYRDEDAGTSDDAGVGVDAGDGGAGGGDVYLVNLIDTPGHIDFHYEVRRSLGACDGALLLIDSTQGVQAQTLANYRIAQDAGLAIIPVLTKLDLPHADPASALDQLERAFGFSEDEVIWTSAKTGEGVDEILPRIVSDLPPPRDTRKRPCRCLLVDSWHNTYRGVVCLIKVVDGSVRKGDKVAMMNTDKPMPYEVQELGVLTPTNVPVEELTCGQVGYMIAGIKNTDEARVGDTIVRHAELEQLEALPGFTAVKPMLYASVYPVEAMDFDELRRAMNRLVLNDSSVHVASETSNALGQGFRCGFLGKLHMEVFFQRLRDEYEMDVISTAPMVPFNIEMQDGSKMTVERPSDLPKAHDVKAYNEPLALIEIVTPPEYVGVLMGLMQDRRGVQQDMQHLDEQRVVLKYLVPWQEMIYDMYDDVKSATSGYASFDYEDAGDQSSDIVCVDMLLNGSAVDALSFVSHRSTAEDRGRAIAKKLKEVISRQQYEIVIQAAIGARPIARERIPPYRKDVLIKSGKTVGGGDVTRKKKLLEKQKKGKARMKRVGNVDLSQGAFLAVMKRG